MEQLFKDEDLKRFYSRRDVRIMMSKTIDRQFCLANGCEENTYQLESSDQVVDLQDLEQCMTMDLNDKATSYCLAVPVTMDFNKAVGQCWFNNSPCDVTESDWLYAATMVSMYRSFRYDVYRYSSQRYEVTNVYDFLRGPILRVRDSEVKCDGGGLIVGDVYLSTALVDFEFDLRISAPGITMSTKDLMRFYDGITAVGHVASTRIIDVLAIALGRCAVHRTCDSRGKIEMYGIPRYAGQILGMSIAYGICLPLYDIYEKPITCICSSGKALANDNILCMVRPRLHMVSPMNVLFDCGTWATEWDMTGLQGGKLSPSRPNIVNPIKFKIRL